MQNNIKKMKNFIILLCLFISFSTLYGQDVEEEIRNIRKMYQNIMEEKDSYDTLEQNVTWDIFEYDEMDDRYVKATMRSYFLKQEKKIVEVRRQITQQWYSNTNTIISYFDNDRVFFIYSINERVSFKYEDDGIKKDKNKIKEERIYLNKKNKCIRYLIKNVEGKPDIIDSLQHVTPNVEIECKKAQKLIDRTKRYLKLD